MISELESLASSTAEASRCVLDMGSGKDLNDCGDCCRHLTGSTTIGWIGQMIGRNGEAGHQNGFSDHFRITMAQN
jgi:hypothetical protein